MLKKCMLYIKLTVLNLFRNNVRVSLTIAGITIGMVLFIIGNAAAESYIQSLYQKAYSFDARSYLLSGSEDDVKWLRDQFPEPDIRVFGFSQRIPVDISYQYHNTAVHHSVTLIGSGANMLDSSICYYDDGYFAASGTLLYGRDISTEDIHKKAAIALIEKSTAIYLFQKENAVGEYIPVKGYYGYHNIEVVGVISDLPSSKMNNFNFNKQIAQSKGAAYTNRLLCYVPDSFLNLIAGKDTSPMYNVRVSAADKENADALIAMSQMDIAQNGKQIAVNSQQLLLKKARSAEKETQGLISMGMIGVMLISGFMVLTVFLFSIKERVYEIGVRRAVGASSVDIIIQFVCEGVILGATSAMISCVVAIQLCNIASYFLQNILFVDFALKIDLKVLFAAAGVSFIQGIVYSFFPALSAAKIKPTEAIRWD